MPNPVARKAVFETLKQVKAIVHEFGLPGHIHVELARAVGKGREERDEITRGIEKRNAEKDRPRRVSANFWTASRMARTCCALSSGGSSTVAACTPTRRSRRSVAAADNSVQVDHILPWSRFGDDSFVNKTLCTAWANQRKKARTAFEWFRRKCRRRSGSGSSLASRRSRG